MPKTKRKNRVSVPRKKLKRPSGWWAHVQRARFLPAIVITLAATTLALHPQSMQSPAHDVLAYATNTSPAGLLSATNTQRINNGVSALSSNSLLSSAAQAKAQDMVNRNYWSHVTPDGQQPWVFISAAGYEYISAGENLAYGFLSSGDTVTGWMNSPPHKQNLLSTAFNEVGFGMANSANYVGNGPQTVVVAMYGAPQVAGASTATPPSSTPKTLTQAAPTPSPAAEPVIATPIESESSESENEIIAVAEKEEAAPLIAPTAGSTNVKRVTLLTNGVFWSATAVIIFVCLVGGYWIIHRGLHIRRYVLAGEHFLAHHLHIDLTVLSIIYLGFVLLSSGGAVR
jgi:uncharacterized protein YkwD